MFKLFLFKLELALCLVKTYIVFRNFKHHVHYTAKVTNASGVYGPGKIVIARNCSVNATGGIYLGGHVHMSENSSIFSVGFDLITYLEDGSRIHKNSEVKFLGNVWITSGAVVPPGTIIRKNNSIITTQKYKEISIK